MKHFGSIIRDCSQGLRVGDPDVEQWHVGASREDPLGHGTTTSDGVWTLSTMCRGWRFGDVLVHFPGEQGLEDEGGLLVSGRIGLAPGCAEC